MLTSLDIENKRFAKQIMNGYSVEEVDDFLDEVGVEFAKKTKELTEAFKEIVTNQVEIPKIKLYFSTDLRQNEETLENTLVEFKLVDGKYKKENVELKLLGM